MSGIYQGQYAVFHVQPQPCLQSLTECYDGMTTCFWAKIPNRDVVLLNTIKEYEYNSGFTVYVEDYKPHWYVVLGQDLYEIESDYYLNPGTWYHFCLKGGRVGNSKEAYLFINGQKLTEKFVCINLKSMPSSYHYLVKRYDAPVLREAHQWNRNY